MEIKEPPPPPQPKPVVTRDELGRVTAQGAAELQRLRKSTLTPQQEYSQALREGCPPDRLRALVETGVAKAIRGDAAWAKLLLDRLVPAAQVVALLGAPSDPGGAPQLDLTRLSREDLETLQRLRRKATAGAGGGGPVVEVVAGAAGSGGAQGASGEGAGPGGDHPGRSPGR